MIQFLLSDSILALLDFLSIDLDLVKGLFLRSFDIDEAVIAHLEVGVIGSDAYAAKDDLGLGISSLPANIDRTYQKDARKVTYNRGGYSMPCH